MISSPQIEGTSSLVDLPVPNAPFYENIEKILTPSKKVPAHAYLDNYCTGSITKSLI
jgi:hypothetical protein